MIYTYKIKTLYYSETFVISAKLLLVSQDRSVLPLVGQKKNCGRCIDGNNYRMASIGKMIVQCVKDMKHVD